MSDVVAVYLNNWEITNSGLAEYCERQGCRCLWISLDHCKNHH